jgi:WD40 repeat protein
VIVTEYVGEWYAFDAETGGQLCTIPPAVVGGFDPSGRHLLSVESGRAVVYDSRTGKTVLTIRPPGQTGAQAASYDPAGRRVVVTYADAVVVHDARTGDRLWSARTPSTPLAVRFSSDGTTLLTLGHSRASGSDGPPPLVATAWASDGTPVFQRPTNRPAVWGGPGIEPLRVNGRAFLTSDRDRTVSVHDEWDGRTTATLQHPFPVAHAELSTDGRRALTASQDGVRVWDLRSRLVDFAAGPVGEIAPVIGTVPGSTVPSPGGTRFAGLTQPGRLTVKDRTGKEVVTLAVGDDGQVGPFDPDARYLRSGVEDGRSRIWDLDTGELVAALDGAGNVDTLLVSADRARLVTGAGGVMTVWDGKTGRRVAAIDNHARSRRAGGMPGAAPTPPPGTVPAVAVPAAVVPAVWGLGPVTYPPGPGVLAALSPDGRRLVTYSYRADGMPQGGTGVQQPPQVWDTQTGDLVATLSGVGAVTASFVFSPDGSRILSWCWPGEAAAVVSDARTGEPVFTLRGHTQPVYSAAFSPDGERVATAGGDGVVKVWDARTGDDLLGLPTADPIRYGPSPRVAFSADGAELLLGSVGRPGRVWDGSPGERIVRTVAPGEAPDGDGRTTPAASSRVAVAPPPRVVPPAPPAPPADTPPVEVTTPTRVIRRQPYGFDIGFTPGGDLLAAGFGHGVGLYDPKTGRTVATVGAWGGRAMAARFDPADPSRGTVYVGSSEGRLLAWQLPDPNRAKELTRFKASVDALAVSPDGLRLAAGLADKTVRVIDPDTGAVTRTLDGLPANPLAVAFPPSGDVLVSGSADGTLIWWDLAGGGKQVVPAAHRGPIDGAAFSPDGNLLATGGGDGVVHLWEAGTRKRVRVLRGPTSNVIRVAFGPDGQLLAAGSHDKTARVWEVATGRQLAVFRGHTEFVRGVGFSPDGASLATASWDGTIRVWPVPPRDRTR